MGWNKLVGVLHETMSASPRHSHLVAVTALDEDTGKVLAWTASEVAPGETVGVRFYVGPASARTVVRYFHGPCVICGADVLEVVPSLVVRQLPEYRIGRAVLGVR
jgi:hypothetical protein